MNPEVFAEWLRSQGLRVIRTPSSWWYEASPRVFQAFPFHWVIRPGEGELLDLVRRHGIVALRYSTPLDAEMGCVSYHAICDEREYGLDNLENRMRRTVRKALQRCSVQRVPLERLADEGFSLEVDTCRRQKRAVSMTKREWKHRYLAAAKLPGFEGWAALVGGRLASSLLCVRSDDWCEMIAQQCLAEFLPARANNALAFVLTQSMLQRPDVRSVFYTVQSLDAPASVDEFKFHMGYVARPVRQRVVFHPWAERIVGPWASRLVSMARRCRPESRLFAKADGMIRFFLQGKQPVSEQEWPSCVEGARGQPAEPSAESLAR